MACLANISVLSSGLGLGFPAITLKALSDNTTDMALNNDQCSWFGKFKHTIQYSLYLLLILLLTH